MKFQITSIETTPWPPFLRGNYTPRRQGATPLFRGEFSRLLQDHSALAEEFRTSSQEGNFSPLRDIIAECHFQVKAIFVTK
jgi:hypothetical protein